MFARNGIYYYRADIPTDLKHYFDSSEINNLASVGAKCKLYALAVEKGKAAGENDAQRASGNNDGINY
jgi:hypothetical protein